MRAVGNRHPRRVAGALAAVAGALALSATAGAEQASPAADSGAGHAEIVRVAGDDRVATALEAARTAFPDSADSAVLATAGDFPDALAAGPLTTMLDAPLLLMPARLSEELAGGFDDLGVGELRVVGGVAAISYLAETDLVAAGAAVGRTAGESRWDTAALLARDVAADGVDEVVIATGTDFPDAVSAAALAGAHQLPVLLTRTDRLPDDTAAVLDELGPSRTTVVGGHAAVGPEVLDGLPDPARLAGEDRTATAVAVAGEIVARGANFDDVVIASARSFADALTAGALAAALDAPLLLVEPDPGRIGAAVALLETDGASVDRMLVVGGPAAVPDDVLGVLADTLRDAGDAAGDEATDHEATDHEATDDQQTDEATDHEATGDEPTDEPTDERTDDAPGTDGSDDG